jgi:hypothetical protein
MSPATTTHTPTVAALLPPKSETAMCWKLTVSGWKKVTAPWRGDYIDRWWFNTGWRLFFHSPNLLLWQAEKGDASDPSAYLYGQLKAHGRYPDTHDIDYESELHDWHFCVEWPALPKLFAEFAPLLKFYQTDRRGCARVSHTRT